MHVTESAGHVNSLEGTNPLKKSEAEVCVWFVPSCFRGKNKSNNIKIILLVLKKYIGNFVKNRK